MRYLVSLHCIEIEYIQSQIEVEVEAESEEQAKVLAFDEADDKYDEVDVVSVDEIDD